MAKIYGIYGFSPWLRGKKDIHMCGGLVLAFVGTNVGVNWGLVKGAFHAL